MDSDQRSAASVGAYDAKSRLSSLLDRVEHGEEIVITRHGRPIARLIPETHGHDTAAALRAVDRLSAIREGLAGRGVLLSQEEIRALRDAGRH